MLQSANVVVVDLTILRPMIFEIPSASTLLLNIVGGTVAALLSVVLSHELPFWLAPKAAEATYHNAFYEYDPDISHFDNTIWTYGTDYILAFAMLLLAQRIIWPGKGLFLCYAISVTCGGLAHQFYLDIRQRNLPSFRFLWTLCVGTVTAASGFMGCLGSKLVKHDRKQGFSKLPQVSYIFWMVYGFTTTLVCVLGGLSFQRPACDIFIAGITQFPSTAYIVVLLLVGLPTIPKWARWVGIIGFLMNAPLLPMYPLLVQYTNLSLAAVNTILHSWLFVSWGFQGLCVRGIEQRLYGPHAVPYKRKL